MAGNEPSEIDEIESSIQKLGISDANKDIPDARTVFTEAFSNKKTHIFVVEQDFGAGVVQTEHLLFIVYFNASLKPLAQNVPMVVSINGARLYFTRTIELETFTLSETVPLFETTKRDGWTHALVYTPSNAMHELDVSVETHLSDGPSKEVSANNFLAQVCWILMDEDASRFPVMKKRHGVIPTKTAATIQQAWHRIVYNARVHDIEKIMGTEDEQEEARRIAFEEIRVENANEKRD